MSEWDDLIDEHLAAGSGATSPEKEANVEGERVHSEVGASGSKRWLACVGSVQLSRGVENFETDAAREGTRLHDLAENVLTGELALESLDENDRFMIEDYVLLCQSMINDAKLSEREFWGTETEVPLWYDPGFQGYVDFWWFDTRTSTLHVVDYKSGRVNVIAEENSQGMIYAAALMDLLELWPRVDMDSLYTAQRVVVHIVQPLTRPKHDHWATTVAELGIWRRTEVDPRIELLRNHDKAKTQAPLEPGDAQCEHCPARRALKCNAVLEHTHKVLQDQFRDLATKVTPPSEVSVEDLRVMLDNAPLIRAFLDGLEQYAYEHIDDFPGYRQGRTSAHRKWADEAKLLERCMALGIDPYEKKIMSPSSFGKLKGVSKENREAVLSELAFQPEGNPKLVREAKKKKK